MDEKRKTELLIDLLATDKLMSWREIPVRPDSEDPGGLLGMCRITETTTHRAVVTDEGICFYAEYKGKPGQITVYSVPITTAEVIMAARTKWLERPVVDNAASRRAAARRRG